MQADILPARSRHLDDKVGTGNEVTQLAEGLGEDTPVVEVFGLTEDEVQPIEGTLQSQVAAHNTHIVPHNLLQFFLGLRDEDHLLVQHHTFGIPVRHLALDGQLPVALSGYGTLRRIVGINHSLQQRVGSQSVATMQTCAGTLAGGIEVADGALAVTVHLDASTLVVGGGTDGDHIARDVDTNTQAFGIDGGETLDELLLANASCVEVEVVLAGELHLVVDGAGHNVSRGQTQPLVVSERYL